MSHYEIKVERPSLARFEFWGIRHNRAEYDDILVLPVRSLTSVKSENAEEREKTERLQK